jgi:signal transduction histidine kinase/tetratricopeptide (TPR) repeat protein
MRKIIFVLSVIMLALKVCGQDMELIQLQQAIQQHPQQDTIRVNLLNALGNSRALQGDEIEKLASEALVISRKTRYAKGEAYALLNMSAARLQLGNRQEAVQLVQQADSIAKQTGDQELIAYVLLGMGKVHQQVNNNTALNYNKRAEAIALKTNNKKLLFTCQNDIASIYQNSLSDFPKAMEYCLKSINSAEGADCMSCLSRGWSTLAALYNIMGDQTNALLYYQKAIDANKKIGDKQTESNLLNNVGERYRLMGKYDEAIKSYNACLELTKEPYRTELTESNLADVYTRIDSLPLAFKYGFSSLVTAKQVDDQEGVAWIYGILSRAYLKKRMADSAIYYAREGLNIAKQTGTIEFMRDNAGALANAYAFKKDFENAYNYNNLYIHYRDSMLNAEITNKSTVLQYNYNLEKKQAEITALDQQKKVQQNFLISTLIVLLLIFVTAIILLRSNRQKRYANGLLQEQKTQIENQRDQTNKALAELQQTQAQLIQSEKMASLGELTAGIAHEIQNPLNFVNNFSEVSCEMLDEMKAELANGDLQTATEIAEDLKQNLEKINHHGKRADATVRGMLQHSRTNSGQKELTDINKLADEYLRLAFHGLRAKDKSFNADLKTDLDNSIGKVNIIPQDIGRVFLNLFNNAFYTVNEKRKTAGETYKPTVSVSTKLIYSQPGAPKTAMIEVSDNGNGIPQNIIDKIFQPFFTTKPTGQGTGLGLSLAYDIVKAHGGEIKTETKEGEGTKFIIQLPVA